MRGETSMLADHLLPIEDLHYVGELHRPWPVKALDLVLQGLGDAQLQQQSAKLHGHSRWLLAVGAKHWGCSHGLQLWVWVIGVTQGSVLRWVVVIALVVDDVLLLLRLLLLWIGRLLLLQLSRLVLLAQGIVRCHLPDGKTTSSALPSGTMNVNNLQFRNRRL
jgi:hypothetical protein